MSLPENEKRKEVLRIALDTKATEAYDQMLKRLKDINTWVRFFPSEFISFLVTDFYETYFESDKDIYVGKFFDSHGFVNSETKKSKNTGNFEEVLRETLAKAEKIRSKSRRKPKIKGMRDNKQINESMSDEKI